MTREKDPNKLFQEHLSNTSLSALFRMKSLINEEVGRKLEFYTQLTFEEVGKHGKLKTKIQQLEKIIVEEIK